MLSEIIPNLYIGTINDAIRNELKFGLTICVAEWNNLTEHEQMDLMCQDRRILFAPFMVYSRKFNDGSAGEPWLIQHCHANTNVLAMIANTIENTLVQGPVPLLINCAAGIERSPLAVVYYLVSKHRYSFDEAYQFVKLKRPIIDNRLSWILEREE
jgi:Dual specificity phosphatase, catalytic domain